MNYICDISILYLYSALLNPLNKGYDGEEPLQQEAAEDDRHRQVEHYRLGYKTKLRVLLYRKTPLLPPADMRAQEMGEQLAVIDGQAEEERYGKAVKTLGEKKGGIKEREGGSVFQKLMFWKARRRR